MNTLATWKQRIRSRWRILLAWQALFNALPLICWALAYAGVFKNNFFAPCFIVLMLWLIIPSSIFSMFMAEEHFVVNEMGATSVSMLGTVMVFGFWLLVPLIIGLANIRSAEKRVNGRADG